jgi:hypothetical protein
LASSVLRLLKERSKPKEAGYARRLGGGGDTLTDSKREVPVLPGVFMSRYFNAREAI